MYFMNVLLIHSYNDLSIVKWFNPSLFIEYAYKKIFVEIFLSYVIILI